MNNLIGGIEAGGTKFVCAVGNAQTGEIRDRITIPTSERPDVTLAAVVKWFQSQPQISAMGIASFGPIDLHRESPTYGYITSTPKLPWQNTDLVGTIRKSLGDIPIGFDTDVNGAGQGEHRWGVAQGLTDFIYITVGTGIGGGGMVGGKLMHGHLHPEMGHIRIPRGAGDTTTGQCPFHGDCWEGLCCGPAIKHRFGIAAENLPANYPAWEMVTTEMAHAIANLTCILSPQRIILGGSIRRAGLLGEAEFFRRIRVKVAQELNGYIVLPTLEEYIVPPGLGDEAGIRGALALATSVQ